jgi:hypothetical protein
MRDPELRARFALLAQVAARQEYSPAPRRPARLPAESRPAEVRPVTDWRVLPGSTRAQRRAAREFERRVREQQRDVERQRRHDDREDARREEQRILRELAEQDREVARRAAARRAAEAAERAQTREFLAKLRDLADYLSAGVRPAPQSTPAVWRRAVSGRWVRAYAAALRFEPRPRNTPQHFERQPARRGGGAGCGGGAVRRKLHR